MVPSDRPKPAVLQNGIHAVIDFFKEASCDNDSGRVSSARVISLMAGSTLSVATLMLTFRSFWHPEMLNTLIAFGPSLAGLAASNYGIQKWTDGKAKTDG